MLVLRRCNLTASVLPLKFSGLAVQWWAVLPLEFQAGKEATRGGERKAMAVLQTRAVLQIMAVIQFKVLPIKFFQINWAVVPTRAVLQIKVLPIKCLQTRLELRQRLVRVRTQQWKLRQRLELRQRLALRQRLELQIKVLPIQFAPIKFLPIKLRPRLERVRTQQWKTEILRRCVRRCLRICLRMYASISFRGHMWTRVDCERT
ncbi:unnamed protein product [Prorocentrum cordatum]|uniref:Uncharacterized protein n=1 Tax=Prorocentrum cordatum TaxID=2364126 RepID=A0ABN9YID9_9DINO|nr:unnamed protein product [Polarella glacialis]